MFYLFSKSWKTTSICILKEKTQRETQQRKNRNKISVKMLSRVRHILSNLEENQLQTANCIRWCLRRSEATNLQKIPRSPWTFQSYWYKPTTLIPSQTLNSDVSLTDFSQIGPTTKWKLNSATAFDLMKLFYLLWVRRMYHRETVAPTWSFYLWDWEGM